MGCKKASLLTEWDVFLRRYDREHFVIRMFCMFNKWEVLDGNLLRLDLVHGAN